MHVNVKLETDAVQYPSDRHLRLCLTFHSLVSFQAFLGLVPPVPHSQSSSMPSPVFQYPTSLDLLLYLWPVLPQGKLPHLSSLHLLSSQSSANVCLLRGHLHAWPTLRSRCLQPGLQGLAGYLGWWPPFVSFIAGIRTLFQTPLSSTKPLNSHSTSILSANKFMSEIRSAD